MGVEIYSTWSCCRAISKEEDVWRRVTSKVEVERLGSLRRFWVIEWRSFYDVEAWFSARSDWTDVTHAVKFFSSGLFRTNDDDERLEEILWRRLQLFPITTALSLYTIWNSGWPDNERRCDHNSGNPRLMSFVLEMSRFDWLMCMSQ